MVAATESIRISFGLNTNAMLTLHVSGTIENPEVKNLFESSLYGLARSLDTTKASEIVFTARKERLTTPSVQKICKALADRTNAQLAKKQLSQCAAGPVRDPIFSSEPFFVLYPAHYAQTIDRKDLESAEELKKAQTETGIEVAIMDAKN
jgi:hypothetical protein